MTEDRIKGRLASYKVLRVIVHWARKAVQKLRRPPRAPWTKADLINHLADVQGYRRYLELCASTTGLRYRDVDRTRLECQRLMYNCPASFDDGMEITFRSTDLDIASCLEEIRKQGSGYDVILVDPWHEYDTSLRDLREAMTLLNPGGTLVVHDCLPRSEELARPLPRDGEWYGITYKAYIDFVTSAEHDFCTVDTDAGCGIIRKTLGGGALPAPRNARELALVAAWRALGDDYASTYRFLRANATELLRLRSVPEFVAARPGRRNFRDFYLRATRRHLPPSRPASRSAGGV